MLDDIFSLVADVEVIIALIGAVLFTAAYASFFQWRKTKAGRAIMYVFISLIAVSFISFLAIWVGPDYWFRPFWRFLGWGTVVFAVVNLNRVLWWNFRHSEKLLNLERRQPKTGENPTVNREAGSAADR